MEEERPGTVGVVDDDPAVLNSFRFMLEAAGCRVATYSSAQNFIERASEQPTCLILDQYMPQVTGLELAERLRAAGNTLPILLITGWPSPTLVTRAAELGIEHVLEKPVDENDVLTFATVHLCR